MVSPDKRLSIQRQCALLGLSRSSFYYKPCIRSHEDLKTMRLMDEMYLEDPTRGTRRFSSDLKEYGVFAGREKIRTLMQIMSLQPIYCKPRTTVIDPAKYKYPYLLRGLAINRPNQVWKIDISYIPMKNGFMYLTAIIDVYSRFIVGWGISNSQDAEWVTSVLKSAIETHGKPEIINSDQGRQFTSDEYINYVKSLETVRISMDGKGRATDNSHIERFFRTIKYEKIYLNPPADGLELYQTCADFINYYNTKRTHSSIGRVAPVKVYRQAA